MPDQELYSILGKFLIDDYKNAKFQVINQGYINDTYLVSNTNEEQFILQRINTSIFKNVDAIHANLEVVLPLLQAEDYTSIELMMTKSNTSYLTNKTDCWRLLTFVDESIAYNFTSDFKIAFEAGRILGRFHALLKDVPISNVVDTLPNLNYLPFHFDAFKIALRSSSQKLSSIAKTEITFAQDTFSRFEEFYNATLPLRICHNDTKLNNILFHKSTGKGQCFIDLDTIMPGYFHYDFGDIIRTAVSESREDETDLSAIQFNLDLFEQVIKGIKSSGLSLEKNETDYLPLSSALLPFMHGLRALTDFLNGNIHYKVTYKNQNLDRCRSLFRVSQLALDKQAQIRLIIEKLLMD